MTNKAAQTDKIASFSFFIWPEFSSERDDRFRLDIAVRSSPCRDVRPTGPNRTSRARGRAGSERSTRQRRRLDDRGWSTSSTSSAGRHDGFRRSTRSTSCAKGKGQSVRKYTWSRICPARSNRKSSAENIEKANAEPIFSARQTRDRFTVQRNVIEVSRRVHDARIRFGAKLNI